MRVFQKRLPFNRRAARLSGKAVRLATGPIPLPLNCFADNSTSSRALDSIQRSPGLWSDNSVGDQTFTPLESTHCGFRFRSEIPNLLDAELRLNLLHQVTL